MLGNSHGAPEELEQQLFSKSLALARLVHG
jgi:hypothetical protein